MVAIGDTTAAIDAAEEGLRVVGARKGGPKADELRQQLESDLEKARRL